MMGFLLARDKYRRGQWLGFILIAFLGNGCAEVKFISHAGKMLQNSQSKQAETEVQGDKAGGNGGYYKIGKPYKIMGQWYYPKEDFYHSEEGIASWYGPNFHGKKTANGAIFDMNLVSAAHRTLPMPSIVRVTNLENGRSLVVKVNDRGPFAHNRIIDLSRRGAELLGFKQKGTALVRVEILEGESRQLASLMQSGSLDAAYPVPKAAPSIKVMAENLDTPVSETSVTSEVAAASAPIQNAASQQNQQRRGISTNPKPVVKNSSISVANKVYIQAGAFRNYVNAKKTMALLSSLGETKIYQFNQGSAPLFRVRLGPLNKIQSPYDVLSAVQNAGFFEARIIVEN